MSRAVIVFVRNPELGKVKTRLALGVGEEKALAIYEALLDHTRKVLSGVDATRYVFYSEEISHSDDWSLHDFNKGLQPNGDLGDRIMTAFEQVAQSHEQIIIVGSDCAQLSTELIERAFTALDEKDAVIGPTFDGGYYLLGTNGYHPALFQNMIWSTEEVLPETLRRFDSNGLSFQKMEVLSDIDFKEDWDRYGWEV